MKFDETIKEYHDRLSDHGGCWSSLALYSVIIMLLIAFAGCAKTVYIPKPEYHEVHDTIIKKEVIEKEVIKEVTVRDSVSFLVKGDTVRIERWHYERDYSKEKELQSKVDSLTKLSRDSVPYPVEVPVYTNELTKIQQKKINAFYPMACAILLLLLYVLRKPIIKILSRCV